MARKHGRPCLHILAEASGDKAPGLLREFRRTHRIRLLNVAGPRGSEESDVAEFTMVSLTKALQPDEKA